MKLNLANPAAGMQKTVDVDDEKRLLPFFEKRMGNEVPGDSIGDEFKGYIFRISGGNDKQGFPMLQGVLSNSRVKLLFKKGMKCYRQRRTGEMKRKSVCGCIVGPHLSILNLVLVKKGPNEIPGLTDGENPRRLGPKRASKIRKLFNLSKTDDVKKFVVRRAIDGKRNVKAPKIQRLITAQRLQRKRRLAAQKKEKLERGRAAVREYKLMVEKYTAEKTVQKMGSNTPFKK
ncbi:small subunit ribosomal protein S6e [Babesia microti strain RI]|uniref:40S ribosomal protein S6 n=1 Tax=Babesia microti (strain RI) TaxID=1133968 RepID=I7IH46_BABMR|nr:small subunit ribosomal protein S6e [Babesia microti strain RI]CCF75177.2 small subunit ribosomal protein S6e [Babesia microti strain RI]|eukprot:XP_021337161.1 small subunit ribosomal protein S6e [Babesia microti strain RI]